MGVGVTKDTVAITSHGESLAHIYTLWVSTSTNEYPSINCCLVTVAIRFPASIEV